MSSLPWNLLLLGSDETKREADKELDQPLLKAVESVVNTGEISPMGLRAEIAFLYLYMVLAGSEKNA